MNSSTTQKTKLVIRSLQYRDLEVIEALVAQLGDQSHSRTGGQELLKLRRWYGLLKFLTLFPNPCQHNLCVYVAEQEQQIKGFIKVKPFNVTRTTWKVESVIVTDPRLSQADVGSQLLRHCLETIWEARTWILEVNINDPDTLALYRQNGFQLLASMTYWAITPELVSQLAKSEPDLPNLLPVSNADAQLIYQLDTASMPPLLRQVFDRHIHDFKTSLAKSALAHLQQWFNHTEIIKGYVFEPQRKAAIGYFQLEACQDGSQPHKAELTVHPAYTWLYPKLLAQMARIVEHLPTQSLQLASADYQSEREDYLEQLSAQRIEHTLLMSRSVWHKLRETRRLEALQLPEVLQGLKPVRTPIPSRISWWKLHPPLPHYNQAKQENHHNNHSGTQDDSNTSEH